MRKRQCPSLRLAAAALVFLGTPALTDEAAAQPAPNFLCEVNNNPLLQKPDGTVIGAGIYLTGPEEGSDGNAALYVGSAPEDLLPKVNGDRDSPDGQYSNGGMIFAAKGEKAALILRDGTIIPCSPNPLAVAAAIARPGQALGTIVREGPGTDFPQVTRLDRGTEIAILEDTGQMLEGRNWFKVRFGETEAYAWGGTICSLDEPVDGMVHPCP